MNKISETKDKLLKYFLGNLISYKDGSKSGKELTEFFNVALDIIQKETVEEVVNKMEPYKITSHVIAMANGESPVVYYLPQSFVDQLSELEETKE